MYTEVPKNVDMAYCIELGLMMRNEKYIEIDMSGNRSVNTAFIATIISRRRDIGKDSFAIVSPSEEFIKSLVFFKLGDHLEEIFNIGKEK